MRPKPLYCDFAAATPLDPRVLRAMTPYFSRSYGNPGSLHSFGQDAITALDRARETLAGLMGVTFRDVIFTASATEANNLAIRNMKPGTILIGATEHESVREAAYALRAEGYVVQEIPVRPDGRLDLDAFASLLTDQVTGVSVMHANNETGTIHPIREIGELVRAKTKALFHVDASQSFAFFAVSPAELGADLVTISSQKIYGPKGCGVLAIGKGVSVRPFVFGGGQEFGIRSGTENVPAIVGCAKAAEIAVALRAKEGKRLSALSYSFFKGVSRLFPALRVNGMPFPRKSETALPHIVNVWFPGILAEDLLTRLDRLGVAASSGSACSARAITGSPILEAMYHKEGKRSRESVRFSFGRPTTPASIALLLRRIHQSL